MMKYSFKHVLVLLLFVLASSCTSTAPTKDTESVETILKEKNLQIAEELNQVMRFQIKGWQYVDRQNVILEDGPSRRVLAELSTPCHSLQNAFAVGLTSKVGTITRNDSLLVQQSPGKPVNCYINRLYRLEKIEG